MKNWKYINGAEVGNQSYKFYGEEIDIAKTDTHTLKEILEELQALHEQGDFQRAIKEELKKRQTGNSDGVARMFQGLVKDEDKDEKHYEGAIDDLEKVGNISKDELLKTLEAEKKLLKVLEERGGEK